MADPCTHLRQWLPFRWRPGVSYLLPCADVQCQAGFDGDEFSHLDVEPHVTGKFPKAVRTVLGRVEVRGPRRTVWAYRRVEEMSGQKAGRG